MLQNELYDPLKYLEGIGTSISDFKEIENNGIPFYILGKGNFAYTEKMTSIKDNKIYSIKKLVISANFNIVSFERETKISIGLNHENIVRFYGYFQCEENIEKIKKVYENDKKGQDLINQTEDKKIYCLALEYVEKGSLEDYYKKYKAQFKDKESFVPLDQKIVLKFAKQILSALKYIHQMNIAHRDIKPDNILLDKDNNIKIADFGISAVFKDDNNANEKIDENLISHYTMVGRKDYVCPEICKHQAYDCRCDIYSLGLTLLYLMSYNKPIKFIKNPLTQIPERHIDKNIDNNVYNEYLIKLIHRMLEDNINHRPFASQAYDEIGFIEKIIENPKDEVALKYLKNKIKPIHLKCFEKRNSNAIICNDSKKKGNSNKTINNNNANNQFNNNCNNVYQQMNQYQNIYNNYSQAFPNSCQQNNIYEKEVYYSGKSFLINQDNTYHNHNNLVMNFNMEMNNNMINNNMVNQNMMNNNTMMGNNNMMHNTMIGNNNMMNNTMMGNMMNNTMMGNMMNNNTIIYNNNMNNSMMTNMMNNNTMMGNNNMMNNTMMGNIFNNNTMMGNNNMMNNAMMDNMFNNNTMMGNMFNNNTMMGNNNMMNNTMIGNNNLMNNTMMGNMMNNNTMFGYNNMNNNTMMDNDINIMSRSSMINKDHLFNHLLNEPNEPKNTSLLSTLQCIYECFKNCKINFSSDLPNDKFAPEIDEILRLIGKISSNDNEKEKFKKSIINFRTEAAKYNPNYFKGNDEIEPINAFFEICKYLNAQYRKNQNLCPNEVYKDLTEFENLPKEKFPEIYDKINQFVNSYHSPFANNFYYILLNISKCPNCNKIIKAKIEDDYSISSFIPLNGNIIDSIGNLVNGYISKQYNLDNGYCDNCNYSGPGKKEKGFLNTPKYLILDFEGEKEMKILDNEIDLTYNSITNIGSKKYKAFAFITKERNDKYKAYIKKDEKNWFSYSDENTVNDEIVCSNNVTPYFAIYKGVESS